MAVTRYVLSGNPVTQVGTAFAGKVEVIIECSVNPLIDTAANVEQVGTYSIVLATGGAWSASLIGTTSSDVNHAPQYRVSYNYVDAATRQRLVWTSGWFNLTAASNLADLSTSTAPDLRLTEGTGQPEGVVTASVGATFVDTAATTGAIRWVKASGSGNTGWVVAHGDTGWRNIDAIGSVYDFTGSTVRLRRRDDLCELQVIANLKVGSTGSSGDKRILDLPTGFAAGPALAQVGEANVFSPEFETCVLATYAWGPSVIGLHVPPANASSWVSGHLLHAHGMWFTSAAWPTALPGTAA
jgi:hypothetical protein